MTELEIIKTNNMVDWDNSQSLKEIRVLFAPKLTDQEFNFFVGIGKATGLNPFLREIWCIKYDSKAPAQTFIGRDGYRKTAQKQKDYDYHQVDSVYSNDSFTVKDGQVCHEYKATERGSLLGAYCLVKKHSSSRPVYTYVELKEYDTNKSNWSKMKATMIKKVAEAQSLRSAFPSEFGGTYDESEDYTKTKDVTPRREQASQLLTQVLTPYRDGDLVSEENADKILSLFARSNFDAERKLKALKYYGVDSVGKLSPANADALILILDGTMC